MSAGCVSRSRTRLRCSSAFVRLYRPLFLARALTHIREARDEVTVRNHEQGRELAVEPLQVAGERRDRYVRQYDAARRSPSDLAAYAELWAAVEQFAAREASLAWLDRGY